MPKTNNDAKKPFQPDWKSIGIGIVAGMFLLAVLTSAGGRVAEWNFGLMKVVIPTPEFTPSAVDASGVQASQLEEAFPSLVSVSFAVDGWNPHMVDLRTAREIGIPVVHGNALKFFDLYVYEPKDTTSTMLQIEFYATGGGFIGHTERLSLVPGMNRFEKVELQSFQDGVVTDAWKVQPEWKVITAVLIYFDENNVKIGASDMGIRLNPESRTWLTSSPDVSFASIAYTVNDGAEMWMDMHQALSGGLNLHPEDKLKITQIWYRAEEANPGVLVGVEAYLTDSQFNRNTYINNPNYPLEEGLHLLSNFSNPIEWVIKSENNMLLVTLARSDGVVVDRLEIPVLSSATQ